jgi:hypothetical protein
MSVEMRMSLKGSDIVVRNADIIGADAGPDFVALDVERGICYSLNRIGSRIWQLIDKPTRVEALCARLAAEYAVDRATCERETLDLLNQLNAEGLLSVGPPRDEGVVRPD